MEWAIFTNIYKLFLFIYSICFVWTGIWLFDLFDCCAPVWLGLCAILFRSPGGIRIWHCRIVWNRRILLPLGLTTFKVLNTKSNKLPILKVCRKDNSGACQQVSAEKLSAHTVSVSLQKIFKCLFYYPIRSKILIQFLCLSQLITYSHIGILYDIFQFLSNSYNWLSLMERGHVLSTQTRKCCNADQLPSVDDSFLHLQW